MDLLHVTNISVYTYSNSDRGRHVSKAKYFQYTFSTKFTSTANLMLYFIISVLKIQENLKKTLE